MKKKIPVRYIEPRKKGYDLPSMSAGFFLGILFMIALFTIMMATI